MNISCVCQVSYLLVTLMLSLSRFALLDVFQSAFT